MSILHTEAITAILKSLYEFVYNQALDLYGNKLLHCRQHRPLLCSPASVAEFYCKKNIEPIHC